jgi:hypothetical protein
VITLYLQRKLDGECTRGCGREAIDGLQLCDECAERQREHQRNSAAFVRELRRDNDLCADCGCWSGPRYRCDSCARTSAESKKLWRAGRVEAG